MISDYKKEFLQELSSRPYYRGKGKWKGSLYLDSMDEVDYAEQFYIPEFEKVEREMAAHLGEPGNDKSVVGKQMRYSGIDKIVERTTKTIPKGAIPLDDLALRVSINRILYLYAQWHLAHPEYSINEGWTVLPDITRTKYCAYVLAKTWVIMSPAHLQEKIDHAFPPRYKNEQTASLRPISVLWLSFAGVTSRELFAIQNKDLDDLNVERQTGTILVHRPEKLGGDQHLPLEPSSIEYLHTLKVASTLSTYRGHNVPRVDGESFLRGIQTYTGGASSSKIATEDDYTYITHRLNLMLDGQKTGDSILFLSQSGAYRSGFYYRAYQEELQTSPQEIAWGKRPRNKKVEKNLKSLDQMIDLWFDEMERQGKTFDDDLKRSKTESRKRLAVYKEYDAWKYFRQSKEMGP